MLVLLGAFVSLDLLGIGLLGLCLAYVACCLPVLHGKLDVDLVFCAGHLGFHMSDDVLLLLI